MTTLAELGLTPTQWAEVDQLDPVLVKAWLEALSNNGKSIKSPVGWFLAAVRTGVMPGATPASAATQEVRNAEAWIRNVGACFTANEEALVANALFGEWGLIRHCDNPTRERLIEMWRQLAAPGFPEDAGPPDSEASDDWSGQ